MAAASVSDDPPLRQKYSEQAIDVLMRALKQGYKDLVLLETDPDLQVIRDLPEFKLLMKGTVGNAPSPGQ
jgi:hypothetical protein